MRPALLLILLLIIPARAEDPSWRRWMVGTMVITTWATLGVTEGLKWGEGNGHADYRLFELDYHSYRAITNVGIIAIPITALGMERDRKNMKLLIGSNLIGWGCYEMAQAYASTRDPSLPKPRFEIMGYKFKRPDPIPIMALSIIGSIAIHHSF